MNNRILGAALAVALFASSGAVLADCAADATVAQVRQSFANAQKQEQAGNSSGAFRAYVAAQEYTCDPNPVATAAAQRAAALGLVLGKAAETAGAFDKAFAIYEDAGQYTAADRALMAFVASKPDDPAVFAKAYRVLEERSSAAFRGNNAIRLQSAGAYATNPQNLTRLMKMPADGLQRALLKEASLMNDQYLRDYAWLIQSRPDDPTDAAAMQTATSAQQLFVRKWPGDLLKDARDAIDLARSWAEAAPDVSMRDKLEARRQQRIDERVALLMETYSDAPAMLETASDYVLSANFSDAGRESRIAVIRERAANLGDAALAKRRFVLAADYYDVADQDAKADAAREQHQQFAMSRVQPSIEQMRKQAEQLRVAYSDPARVQAMREQALAAQKSLRQSQPSKQASTLKADELEKELGL